MSDTRCGVEVVTDTVDYFRVLNPHCLDSIFRLSETARVTASCDIVDECGTTLVLTGEPVSREIQKTFLSQRLQRPLESCLDAENAESLEGIVGDCFALMKRNPALEALGGSSEAMATLRGMGHMPLHGALRLLLTLFRAHQQSHYDKRLGAMIICSGLAHGVGLDDDDTDLLILSALVHDIGELYINPEYLDDRHELSPDEWAQLALHPGIGYGFIRTFTRFPIAVADCVQQHHERVDGSGYPHQLQGSNMNSLGKLIGVADTVSALILRGDSGREPGLCKRIALALKLFPEEFPQPAVTFVTSALAHLDNDSAPAVSGVFAERILPTLQQIRAARRLAAALASAATTDAVAHISRFALETIRAIDKSLHEIGVYDLSQVDVLEKKPEVMGEACQLLGEVAWRLRHLARMITLRAAQSGDAGDLAQVAELVAVLNERPFAR